jgi:uncharacterized membrane protein
MKKLLAGMLAFGLTFAIGCEHKSAPGGPGAVDNKTQTRSITFKIIAPGKTELKQGEEKEVRVKVDRGKDFKEDVTLKFETPKGIHVDREQITVRPGEDFAAVKVKADKDAPIGDNSVNVKATPQHGESTEMKFDVKVDRGAAE